MKETSIMKRLIATAIIVASLGAAERCLSTGIDCHAFPLGSYALEDLPEGIGNIQVKP
jgi:hypothetical protein